MNNVDFLKNRIIAHRGYHDISKNIPENSIASYKRAIEYGYAIEIDLHLLKDGNIVSMHDDYLERMTGNSKKLVDCTYDEIKDLKLLGTEEHIPLLKEILDLVNGRVPLLIEYKYDNKPGLLEEKSMELLKNYKGEYAVQSFNPESVKWFKTNYENIPRGQLSSTFETEKMCFIKKYILKNVLLFSYNKPDFISYSIKGLPNKRIEKIRKNGVLILGWTVKDEDDFKIGKKYCDNLICEKMDEYINK